MLFLLGGIVLNEYTHKKITSQALNFVSQLTDNQKEKIINFSAMPDKDENKGAYKWHFYNPATRKNFRGERISALSKFLDHYQTAKDKNSLSELGRAIHYLEDLNTPVHTYYEDLFDATYRLKQHIEFERFCDELIKTMNTSNVELNYKYFLVNSLRTIGKSCAMKASVLFHEQEENPKNKESVARTAINNGIVAVRGILARYFGGV